MNAKLTAFGKLLLSIIDAVLAILWSITKLAARVIAWLWRAAVTAADMIFRRRRGRRRHRGAIARRWNGFITMMDESKPARRWLFGLLLLGLLLLPSAKWRGSWNLYQQGVASHYGPGFYFKRTASGDLFVPWRMTAAHNSLPFGTLVKVIDRKTGAAIQVTINDRGPFVDGRIIDLSWLAAWRLGILRSGTAPVDLYVRPSAIRGQR